jgi:hypothetical protein
MERQQRLVQQTLLHNYPNPERKGCPGSDMVRDLATRSVRLEILSGDEQWEHLMHCSPCYGEFLRIVKRLRGQK